MKKNSTITIPFFALIILALLIGIKMIESRIISSGGNLYLSVIIIQILIFIIPAAIFCRLQGIGYTTKLNVKLFSPGKFGTIAVTAVALILGSVIIRYVQHYVFGLEQTTVTIFKTYLGITGGELMLPSALAFAIMPAICDEFIFRVIVLSEYNNNGINGIAASIASVVLYCSMCMSVELLPLYIICGIGCCMITYSTGSSLPAFIVHIIFNLYLVFGEKYFYYAITNPANKVISVFFFGILFLLSLILLFAEYQRIAITSSNNGTPTPEYLLMKDDDSTPDIAASNKFENDKGSRSRSFRNCLEVIFSPTMLLCILVFVITLFSFS